MRINENGIYRDLMPEEELNFDKKLSAAEQREQVYNTAPCIEWGGEMITVTQAVKQWTYYAAEGRTDKTDKLTELIAEAKQTIRTQWTD